MGTSLHNEINVLSSGLEVLMGARKHSSALDRCLEVGRSEVPLSME